MSSGRFLFNVPASALQALVEAADASGAEYPTEAAIADLQLTADAGRVYGQRTYAERWAWSYKTVRYHWSDLTAEAARRATSDGRQLDNPAARDVPPEWLENAGIGVPKGAGIAQDGTGNADPGRTPGTVADEGRTQGRTSGAPGGAGNGQSGTGNVDPGRTQGRTSGAPKGADLPSRIPHPEHPSPPTDRPSPAHAREAAGRPRPDGSVGRGNEETGGGVLGDVVARLRRLGEDDDRLTVKADQLLSRKGADVVRRVLADLEGQPAGAVRSPFGWLAAQVEKAERGQHRHTASHIPELVEREVYTDSQRERAIGGGVQPGHFHQAGYDEANRKLWMYLPDGPRRAEPYRRNARERASQLSARDLADSAADSLALLSADPDFGNQASACCGAKGDAAGLRRLDELAGTVSKPVDG